MSITLKEIAQKAGVSISTVSRVINKKNTKAASPEVQERIWKIVRENGYTPNTTAQKLKQGIVEQENVTPQKSIAIIYARSDSSTNDQFFSQIAKAVERECFKRNCYIRYSFTAFDFSKPSTFERMNALDVDGLVVLGLYDKNVFNILSKYNKPFCCVGLNHFDPKFDQVICCGGEIAKSVTYYLHSLGHTHIAYIGAQANEIRFTGYKRSLEKLNIPFDSSYTVNARQTSDGGYRGAHTLLDRHPDVTAIFCANDYTAIGAMRAIKERGYRIPQDISIIGIDDIDTDQYLIPMLSSVHIPLDDLGRHAARILLHKMESSYHKSAKLILPSYIVKRDSCCPPAKNKRM